ncbi:hypothetical protein B5F96_14635 [Parabacteroides johnsonii]|uniref:Uncharacterized protein n=1 Tax=Parabacteroides johnsonii TaxID=387661 RepID=A0A9Q5SQ23_9BACT|nr:hypothetical protein B5F96_14635 [Parabacteroides johnsonii]
MSPRLTRGRKRASLINQIYMTGFNAIPRQAREQDSFDTPVPKIEKEMFFTNTSFFISNCRSKIIRHAK